jgi:TonB family protein
VNVSLPATPRRKALKRITPGYPPEAEEIGLAGEVVLKVSVNSAGDVTRTDRISSTVDLRPDEVGGRERIEFFAQHPYAFAQASEAAAKEWTFEPARTSMTVFVAFLFTLKSPEEAARAAASTAGAALPQGPALARPGPPPAASQSGPLRVGGAIKPPTRLVNVNPDYPEDAKAAGVQGVVILQIIVGEDGTVTDARVVRSIPELDRAAIDAVRQWQYEPTLLNGVPVEVELTVTINFTLR